MDFVQSSKSLNWMGRYSWSHDDEVTPALKLNGSKLLNTVHQLMIGNTYTLSPTVLNEFRFGYNSFFNTFGRELAFVRDVVDGARHSRRLGGPARSRGGFRPSASPGSAASATARKAPTPTGTRCSSSPTTCPGSAARHSFKAGAQPSGSISTTRWATSSRAVRSRSTDGPRDRRPAWRRRAPPRSPTSCWATCARSESAVALATTELPRHQPGLLLHRYVAHARQHDARSRHPLRVRATVARQGRHADQRVPAVSRHRAAGGRPVPSSGARAHRRGRLLRGLADPVRAQHPDVARRRAGRAPGRRRQVELRAARRVGVDAERQLVGPRRRRRLLHAGHRESALRHGAQRGRPPAGHLRPAAAESELERAVPGSGTNVCGVQPPLVCVVEPLRPRQHVRPQDAVHGAVRVQRPARARTGPRRSKSATSDRAASGSSGCSTPTK